jgi:hypothetical protein
MKFPVFMKRYAAAKEEQMKFPVFMKRYAAAKEEQAVQLIEACDLLNFARPLLLEAVRDFQRNGFPAEQGRNWEFGVEVELGHRDHLLRRIFLYVDGCRLRAEIRECTFDKDFATILAGVVTWPRKVADADGVVRRLIEDPIDSLTDIVPRGV